MKPDTAFPAIHAPVAEKRPAAVTRHGITRTDDYAWLRAENWQEVFRDPSTLDAAIRRHLEAENLYQSAMMGGTEPLRKTLFAEMKGRIKEDDSSVPEKDGPFAYGASYRTGGEHPRYFRTPREGGPETIYLDGDTEAEGAAYFRIGGADHSPDHKRLVWGYDDKGSNSTRSRSAISPRLPTWTIWCRIPAAAVCSTLVAKVSSTPGSTRTTDRRSSFTTASERTRRKTG